MVLLKNVKISTYFTLSCFGQSVNQNRKEIDGKEKNWFPEIILFIFRQRDKIKIRRSQAEEELVLGKITVRDARIEDAARILEIYAYYVEHTVISFEWDVPSLEEF